MTEIRRQKMKILYRQMSRVGEISHGTGLEKCGIHNCYFKRIRQEDVDKSNTKKRHSHTGFEFHLIVKGCQTYESEDGVFCVNAGEFIMMPPGKAHKFLSAEYPVEKYAVTFSYASAFELKEACVKGEIPRRVTENIAAVEDELAKYLPFSEMLIENCVLEIALCLIRECSADGFAEQRRGRIDVSAYDERVELARQFIDDNIEEPLQIGEVASYCYLSEKQLTRLFEANMGMTVAAYIRREKIRHIERLLADKSLTLLEISETMGFPNESGFNAFFKKYNGMPPGEYRKMITNGRE